MKIDETALRYVPKACYYPLIKGSIDSIEVDDIKESVAQKLLRDICGALVKKLEINC